MDKVVVTGGAGFIGSHLVDALVADGYEVHIIDDLSAGKKENVNQNAILHIKDIRNADALGPIFSGAQYVFHLAALPRVQYSIEHPRHTNDVNLSGTLNVLTAAKEAGVKRVLFAASSAAYGDQKRVRIERICYRSPKAPTVFKKTHGGAVLRLFQQALRTADRIAPFFSTSMAHG